MNLILLVPGDFVAENRVCLGDRRFTHITVILQGSIGKSLQMGLIDGNLGTGRITRIGATEVELEVCLDQPPPSPLPVTLLLALPRPKVLKRILEGVTAMGVKQIVLFNSWRVDKSYWQSPVLQPEALHEHCLLGLEQSRDTLLPKITLQRLFKPFVEDILPHLAHGRQTFVAHPGSDSFCPAGIDGQAILAIGPEGGFTPFEIASFRACGFAAVHLGPRALKVETAVPAFLGRLVSPCT